jgi:hypothetical protein
MDLEHKISMAFALSALVGCNSHVDKPMVTEPHANVSLFSQVRTQIFQRKCGTCHLPDSASGVDLTSYQGVMDSKIVVPFDPNASQLYDALVTGRMPMDGAKLPPEDIQLVHDWISQGAKE